MLRFTPFRSVLAPFLDFCLLLLLLETWFFYSAPFQIQKFWQHSVCIRGVRRPPPWDIKQGWLQSIFCSIEFLLFSIAFLLTLWWWESRCLSCFPLPFCSGQELNRDLFKRVFLIFDDPLWVFFLRPDEWAACHFKGECGNTLCNGDHSDFVRRWRDSVTTLNLSCRKLEVRSCTTTKFREDFKGCVTNL